MPEIEDLLLNCEFTPAETPVFEMNRNLDDSLAGTFDEDLQTNLVPDRIEFPAVFKRRAPESEKTGHRVMQVRERSCQQCCNPTVNPAQESPVFGGAASGNITRTDDQIRGVIQLRKHMGDGFRWMAKDCIHANQELASRKPHAIENSAA